MSNITRAIESIAHHEGFIPHAYKDHLGYWTIGHGILIDAEKGGGITREESLYLLKNRLADRIFALDVAEPWWRELPDEAQVVLMNMAYQLGANGLLGFKIMWAALEHHDFKLAAKEMLDSKWAHQTPNRARELASIMEGLDSGR